MRNRLKFVDLVELGKLNKAKAKHKLRNLSFVFCKLYINIELEK
jgi:hypothetical protein